MLVDRLQMKPREACASAGLRLYKLALQRNFTRGRRTGQVSVVWRLVHFGPALLVVKCSPCVLRGPAARLHSRPLHGPGIFVCQLLAVGTVRRSSFCGGLWSVEVYFNGASSLCSEVCVCSSLAVRGVQAGGQHSQIACVLNRARYGMNTSRLHSARVFCSVVTFVCCTV